MEVKIITFSWKCNNDQIIVLNMMPIARFHLLEIDGSKIPLNTISSKKGPIITAYNTTSIWTTILIPGIKISCDCSRLIDGKI
jgi:hypothetical protein